MNGSAVRRGRLARALCILASLSTLTCKTEVPSSPSSPSETGGAEPSLPGVSSVLAPIVGPFRVTGTENVACSGKNGLWTFCQHQTGDHHPGGGIAGSDDTYAWDINETGPNGEFNIDQGQAVYAAASGTVVKYANTYSPGSDACNSVLIQHSTGPYVWWSGYLHMSVVMVTEGQQVTSNTQLGQVGHSCATNDHLHFVVYTGQNAPGALVSRDVAFTERVSAPTAAQYAISLAASPASGGSVNGAGTYGANATAIVVAAAASGYVFSNWSENQSIVSTSASYQFVVTSSRALTANFTAAVPTSYLISISANPLNGGSVSGSGFYSQNSTVLLTATPASGYRFSNWTESGVVVSTSANYQFAATSNRALVANFAAATPTSYAISVSPNPTNAGSATGGGTYGANSTVTVSASPSSGYSFTSWTETGTVVSTSASYQFTATGNRTLVANFAALVATTYVINVSPNPPNSGSTFGNGTFNANSTVTVSAIAVLGFTFNNWTENGVVVSTNASYQFLATSNRTLVANFVVAAPASYAISVSTNPTNAGSVTGGGTYSANSSVTVGASPANGYSFTSWTENGTVVSTNASYQFAATSNRTLVANFASLPTYFINVSASPPTGGSAFGGGAFYANTLVTLTAAASTGYLFSNWTENGSVVSASPSYQFTVASNRTLVANFTSLVSAPSAPTLVTPGTSSSPGPLLSTLTPTMVWTAVSGATGYGVYVRDITTNILVYNNDNVGNIVGFVLPSGTLVAGHLYKWNARAFNAAGWGPFSFDFFWRE